MLFLIFTSIKNKHIMWKINTIGVRLFYSYQAVFLKQGVKTRISAIKSGTIRLWIELCTY